MEIIKIEPLGFCHGVKLAIDKVKELRKNNPTTPIYLWGPLVHNQNVINDLKKLEITTLDVSKPILLNKLDKGIIVTSAHGTAKKIVDEIISNGFSHFNASCPIINTLHENIKASLKEHDLLFYGKQEHPEMIAALALDNKIVPIYDNTTLLSIKDNSVLFSQTTFTEEKVNNKYNELKKINKSISKVNSLCNATSSRQAKLIEVLPTLDHVIVVGDKNSNNAMSLVNIIKSEKNSFQFINSKNELDFALLDDKKRVGIVSATSTPLDVVNEIIDSLK